MKRKIFSFSLMAGIGLLAFGVVGLSACNNNTSFTAASVKLNINAKELKVGESVQLKASVTKGYGSDITWVSSNDKVIDVNNGYCIAVGAGEAKVHAFIGGGHDYCDFTVTAEEIIVNTDKLEIDPTAKTIHVGETFTIATEVSPADTAVTFSTNNAEIADVDENTGVVTAGNVPGVAVITVSAPAINLARQCTVTVLEEGEEIKSLEISPVSKSLEVGDEFTLSYVVEPEGTAVEFASSASTVATVDADGKVTAIAAGTAVITVSAPSIELSKQCNVTVTEKVEPVEEDDIAVPTNLGYSGSLTIGSPLIQREFMQGLLADFNTKTGSNIEFTVTTFEEDNGTSGYNSPESMPAVFPYASDQTLTLYQFNALSTVGRTDSEWIRTNMGNDAYNAARLTSVVGYPFASDNGVVMFYNKAAVNSIEDIDTLDELFAKATELEYEVNYMIGNGFYAAGALMTYTGGASLYTLTPTTTAYTSSSTFNSDAGLKGAKLVRRIANEEWVRNASAAPRGDVLATIVDVSKVQDFKRTMGENYAVAPLPFVDSAKTIRLGSYLGYKFYGVNNTLNATDKEMAAAVAKFLCSAYVQAKRFNDYNTGPTLTSLQELAASEPHIAALNEQKNSHSTIALTATGSELWSATATAVTSLKGLSATATDDQYQSILEVLDAGLRV